MAKKIKKAIKAKEETKAPETPKVETPQAEAPKPEPKKEQSKNDMQTGVPAGKNKFIVPSEQVKPVKTDKQRIQDLEDCLDKVCEILIKQMGAPAEELKKWWNED